MIASQLSSNVNKKKSIVTHIFSLDDPSQEPRERKKGRDKMVGGTQMGASDGESKMEGWLYLIRSNRFGMQSSRKRYFMLQENSLKCFKYMPLSRKEEPTRSALIDSSIRVMDNGRENTHRKVLFIFTLYNSADRNDRLKLGARSSEEAARWIRSLKEATMKEYPNQGDKNLISSKSEQQYFRLKNRKRNGRSYSFGYSSIHAEPARTDVIAPSSWTIFGCQNGLRLFKEARDRDLLAENHDYNPAIMSVGVIDATSEVVFQTVMSLDVSRSEWDFCFHQATVIEHVDGHTDVIHIEMKNDWLPWGMKSRDFLVRRHWRRENDGTYVILYHSVFHRNCLPTAQYVRSTLKSGGYIISPLNQGRQSVVKNMLSIDWKFWKSYLFKSCSNDITVKMTERIAALREMLNAKHGSYLCTDLSSDELTRHVELPEPDCSSDELTRHVDLPGPPCEKEDIKVELQPSISYVPTEEDFVEQPEEEKHAKTINLAGSFLPLGDTTDEFYDAPEPSDYEYFDLDSEHLMSQCENSWPSDAAEGKQRQVLDTSYQKPSPAAVFVKKLHGLAVQRGGYMDLREVVEEEEEHPSCCYGSTLLEDTSCSAPCSWTTTDPATFLIRGKDYLHDRTKIKPQNTLMKMVGADWVKSDRREDDLAGRPGSIVQKYAEQGRSEFFLVINMQVPGSTTYALALYYMLDSPLEDTPLLESFVKGDDAYRNSRFKLIPYISKGPWIVKQSVGKKACILGQALEMNYFHGKNYLELGVNIGSSAVARNVVGLVLGYLNQLVIEMAFLIQANTAEELPEFLLGTCRLNHLDIAKSVHATPRFF